MATVAVGGSPFGSLLRQWRTSRGLSQLALATAANTTSRHVSFLETGRSRPTQSMVLRLCDALAVPLRARNQLLVAAGLAPAYGEAGLDTDRYEPVRRALGQLLGAHEPYPAIVLDGHSTVLAANGGAAKLFGENLTGRNLMEQYLAGGPAFPTIVNWPDVARAVQSRLRSEAARSPLDPTLRAALELTDKTMGGIDPEPAMSDLFACPWFEIDGRIIRTLVLAARFDSALDVTLDELRIELIYPLDDEADTFFRSAPLPRAPH